MLEYSLQGVQNSNNNIPGQYKIPGQGSFHVLQTNIYSNIAVKFVSYQLDGMVDYKPGALRNYYGFEDYNLPGQFGDIFDVACHL